MKKEQKMDPSVKSLHHAATRFFLNAQHHEFYMLPLSASFTAFLLLTTHGVYAAPPSLPPSTSNEINNARSATDFADQKRARAIARGAALGASTEIKAPSSDTISAPAGADKVSFKLNAVHFSPSKVFSQQDLDGFVAPYVGQKILVSDLFKLTAQINQEYRNRGYITTQAILAPQNITAGEVEINLVEGVIGDISATGNRLVSSRFVVNRVQVEPGVIPTIKLLEEKISSVNWNRNYKVTAGLKPGRLPGTTDLNLDVSGEPKRFSGSVYLDNHGSDDSGRYNLGFTGSLYSLFGYDETLSFGMTTSQDNFDRFFKNIDVGSFFLDAQLPMPVGNGTIHALYSHSKSSVFGSSFIKGGGDFGSLSILQPVYSAPYGNVVLLGGLEISDTDSSVGIVQTDTRSYRAFGGVQAQMSLPSTGTYLSSEFRVTYSSVEIAGLSGPEHRDILRFGGNLLAVQDLGNGFNLTMNAVGQYSPQRRLPSGEQWYLGGSRSLPGYEVSSIAGDTGFFLKSQIQYTSSSINDYVSQQIGAPFNIAAKAFFDVGAVYDDYIRAYEGNYYLDAGVGLDFKISDHLSGDVVVAWPINPDNDPDLKIGDSPRVLFSLKTTF